ncbi:MAG: hypothetical protein JWM36_3240 [Hyphomicrobiales bacterium]|nr:hypothetical protein [Hyphomicrobiales bacterium]
MNILRHELYQRVFNTPLMMHPGKAQAALEAIGGRLVEGGVVIISDGARVDHTAGQSAGRLGDQLGARMQQNGQVPYAMAGSVAIIPIEGTLVHKGAYVGASSGRTSYQGLQTQIARAARDDTVLGVVFEVDSFGGEVAGAFETAAMMAELSRLKPTMAILTDHAASAGYLLASAARQIVMPETGTAGSIGVITMHTDVSKALKKEGVKVTIIAAGKHKADRNPLGPLPEDVQSRVQASVEKSRQIFADTVGRHRGSRFTAKMALATEAETFDGADAVRIGLVDAVGHSASAFHAFVSEMSRPRGR